MQTIQLLDVVWKTKGRELRSLVLISLARMLEAPRRLQTRVPQLGDVVVSIQYPGVEKMVNRFKFNHLPSEVGFQVGKVGRQVDVGFAARQERGRSRNRLDDSLDAHCCNTSKSRLLLCLTILLVAAPSGFQVLQMLHTGTTVFRRIMRLDQLLSPSFQMTLHENGRLRTSMLRSRSDRVFCNNSARFSFSQGLEN
jgi:hypothetical protein